MKIFIHLQTSTVKPLEQFHVTLYWTYDYLSMLRLKLIHFSERGPWYQSQCIHRNIITFMTSLSLFQEVLNDFNCWPEILHCKNRCYSTNCWQVQGYLVFVVSRNVCNKLPLILLYYVYMYIYSDIPIYVFPDILTLKELSISGGSYEIINTYWKGCYAGLIRVSMKSQISVMLVVRLFVIIVWFPGRVLALVSGCDSQNWMELPPWCIVKEK